MPTSKLVPLKAILGEKTGLAVLVGNAAMVMTYAEFRYGAALGRKNVSSFTMGTGIGGGVVQLGAVGVSCLAQRLRPRAPLRELAPHRRQRGDLRELEPEHDARGKQADDLHQRRRK